MAYRRPDRAGGLGALRRGRPRPRAGQPEPPGARVRLPPGGLGPGSAWAAFFAFCHDRWRLGRQASGPYVHGIELVNEPNFQLWPQRAPATGDDPFALGEPDRAGPVAQMMATAASVAARRRRRHAAVRALVRRQRARRPDGDAVRRVHRRAARRARRRRPAAGPDEAWSHHNYTDLERRSVETKLQRMRGAHWRAAGPGFSEGALPTVFVTEGGVRLSKMARLLPERGSPRGPGAELAAGLGPPRPRRRARRRRRGCSRSTRPTPTRASTAGCSTHGRRVRRPGLRGVGVAAAVCVSELPISHRCRR